jgi:hypothetical protein
MMQRDNHDGQVRKKLLQRAHAAERRVQELLLEVLQDGTHKSTRHINAHTFITRCTRSNQC